MGRSILLQPQNCPEVDILPEHVMSMKMQASHRADLCNVGCLRVDPSALGGWLVVCSRGPRGHVHRRVCRIVDDFGRRSRRRDGVDADAAVVGKGTRHKDLALRREPVAKPAYFCAIASVNVQAIFYIKRQSLRTDGQGAEGLEHVGAL